MLILFHYSLTDIVCCCCYCMAAQANKLQKCPKNSVITLNFGLVLNYTFEHDIMKWKYEWKTNWLLCWVPHDLRLWKNFYQNEKPQCSHPMFLIWMFCSLGLHKRRWVLDFWCRPVVPLSIFFFIIIIIAWNPFQILFQSSFFYRYPSQICYS